MSRLPEIHTERLRTFLAVVREQGFSRAARALGQSQSSVSQAVLSLERELGEPLFVRDGRRTHLTQAGRVMAQHGERAFRELRRAQEELSLLKQLRAGTLVVGTSDTLATYLLPPVFAAFRARYPDVELRLDNRPSPRVAARVVAHRADVGIVSLPFPAALKIAGRPLTELLRIIPLVSQREVAVFPRAHALARRRKISIEELAAEPLLLLDRTTSTRALLEAQFAELSRPPRVVMETSSVEVVKRYVTLGFGVSVIPEMAVSREVEAGLLCARPLVGSRPREVALVTSTAGPLSHAARAFIEVAEEHVSPPPSADQRATKSGSPRAT
jgi:DNA-binding transcriptional LysR family regulator